MLNFRSTKRPLLVAATWAASFALSTAASAADRPLEYRVLATSKTSTMEKELNEAAAAGYRFSKAMGGKSANRGQEVIVAMVKDPAVRTRSPQIQASRHRQDVHHAKRNATGGG